MWGANLSRVKLRETNLSRAKLWKANLSQARFEPLHGTLPPAIGLLGLRGLDSLTFKGSSSFGLMDLREIFKKAGMREEERQVTYALNRNRRINTWEEIKEKATDKGKKKTEEEKGEEKEITWATLGIAWLENTFQLVFFEWTCDYGMTPSKPLDIMFFFIPVFVLPYLLAFGSRDTKTGIWVLLLPDRVLERELKGRPFKLTTHRPFYPLPERSLARFKAHLWRGRRVLRLAFYFSLLSAFNLGWRELNVGAWITRIQKREYTLRATGWPRTVAGLQSLISVYLLALWALSYFGRPFE